MILAQIMNLFFYQELGKIGCQKIHRACIRLLSLSLSLGGRTVVIHISQRLSRKTANNALFPFHRSWTCFGIMKLLIREVVIGLYKLIIMVKLCGRRCWLAHLQYQNQGFRSHQAYDSLHLWIITNVWLKKLAQDRGKPGMKLLGKDVFRSSISKFPKRYYSIWVNLAVQQLTKSIYALLGACLNE